jgi:hypothetical protein|tara:strand:+ start:244 stop:648 length:405 start_codon:yes stop_codon:yes gene_type:complete
MVQENKLSKLVITLGNKLGVNLLPSITALTKILPLIQLTIAGYPHVQDTLEIFESRLNKKLKSLEESVFSKLQKEPDNDDIRKLLFDIDLERDKEESRNLSRRPIIITTTIGRILRKKHRVWRINRTLKKNDKN